jgi:hypothetical protein
VNERTEAIIRERLRTASGWLRASGYVEADADIGHLLGEVARLEAEIVAQRAVYNDFVREANRRAAEWREERSTLLPEVARLTAALELAQAADDHDCDDCRRYDEGCGALHELQNAATVARRVALAGTGEPQEGIP